MAKLQWKKLEVNEILTCDGFHVSYNPDTIGTALIKSFKGDSREETALVKGGDYFILNGDFRKQYEKLSPKGFDACKEFFDKNADKKSSWSN